MQRSIIAAAILIAATQARAQAYEGRAYSDGHRGAVMDVPLNKSQVLRLDRPFARAIVGNSEIADVLPTSVSSIYVMGKKIGSTNLTIIDKRGGFVAVVDVVVGPDSLGLKRQISDLMPTEHVGVSVSNDSLVIDGPVSSPAAAERIASIAETFAPKKVVNLMSVGQPQQVLLEVRFSEMTRGTVKQLGISQLSFFNNGVTTSQTTVPAIDTKSNPYQFLVNAGGVFAQIDALEQKGLIHTLAQPNLVALSGESANFLAGGEFPVPTGITITGQITIEFKPFGVSLAFVPTVLEDGMINLVVAPEVSSLDPAAGIQLSGLQIPGLKTRRAKTSIELRDGQAFAMAGLIQSDFSDTIKAIPLLGRVPIIGALFRSTYFNRNETELVILVTPHIVRPVRAGDIQLPTDRVQQPSDTDLLLFGHTEHKVQLRAATLGPKPGGIESDYGHVVR